MHKIPCYKTFKAHMSLCRNFPNYRIASEHRWPTFSGRRLAVNMVEKQCQRQIHTTAAHCGGGCGGGGGPKRAQALSGGPNHYSTVRASDF
jgi:hypothetical protein